MHFVASNFQLHFRTDSSPYFINFYSPTQLNAKEKINFSKQLIQEPNNKNKDILKLRRLSGAGIKKCVESYQKYNGDMELSLSNILREMQSLNQPTNGTISKLLNNPVLPNGQIGLISQNGINLMIQLKCQTSFVSRSKIFLNFIKELLMSLHKKISYLNSKGSQIPPIEELVSNLHLNGIHLKEELAGIQQRVGEKIGDLQTCVIFDTENSKNIYSETGTYLHNRLDDSIGQIGVMVQIIRKNRKVNVYNDSMFKKFSTNIAMHIAAANPQSTHIEELDPSLIEDRKSLILKNLDSKLKDSPIVEKIVQGKLQKYFREIILTQQEWYLDETKRTVQQVLKEYSNQIDEQLEIQKFFKFSLSN